MAPVWLIAERELRTYVATASFWVALAIVPLLMIGAALVVGASPSSPTVVRVSAQEPALARSAETALTEAAATEGRNIRIAAGSGAPALVLTRSADGSVDSNFGDGFPLSATGRALVTRTLERTQMLRQLELAGTAGPALRAASVRMVTRSRPRSAGDPGALSRFALVMPLWLVLTGSLGMLLQAVVRERSNRALESLLASVRPWEIVWGKLLGVGAVSLLVLAVWLGSGALMMGFGKGGAVLVQVLAAGVNSWAALARAGMVYGLAFVLYGSVTVALGAMARDSASAQNLSRPMFAVLLAAFFAVLLSGLGSAPMTPWLILLPPFTPFLLLLCPPGALPGPAEAGAFAILATSAALAGSIAVRSVTLAGGVALRPKLATMGAGR